MQTVRSVSARAHTHSESLELIADAVRDLAAHEAFNDTRFEAPLEGAKSHLYLLAAADEGPALYLNASRGGEKSPVHNHLTWAAIAGISGAEHNRLFDRRDDDAPVEVGETVVGRGDALALGPDDYHAISLEGPARLLHCYGRRLDQIQGRTFFDPRSDTWVEFDLLSAIVDMTGQLG